MIFIGLKLTNPWAKEVMARTISVITKFSAKPASIEWYGSGYVRDYRLTKNKNFEIQVMRSPTLVAVALAVGYQVDPAGARLEIGLLGFDLILTLYDSRLWNDETDQYENYEEENE